LKNQPCHKRYTDSTYFLAGRFWQGSDFFTTRFFPNAGFPTYQDSPNMLGKNKHFLGGQISNQNFSKPLLPRVSAAFGLIHFFSGTPVG
jgi:hypothetical protein